MSERIGDGEVRITGDDSHLQNTIKSDQRSLKRHFSWIRKQRATATVDLNDTPFQRQLKKIKAEREALDRSKAEVDVDLNTMGFFARSRLVKREMASLRKSMRAERGEDTFDKWITSLMSVRVQMGFVSLTVRQFIRVITLLGPIVTSLAGSFIALSGALTTGLLGALAAVSSSLAGLGLTLGGTFAAVKPYIAGVKNAAKASQAYQQQVQKTGVESEKAKKKLAELNSVMAHVPAESRDAIRSWGKVAASFRKLTRADSRQLVTTSLNEGVKTSQRLLPAFAAQVNSTMGSISQSIQRIGKGLRGKEGQGILDRIMGGANLALPSLLKGFEQLAAVLGKVLAAAAPSGVDLAVAFEKWATALNNGLAPSKELGGTISRWVGYFRDIVKLLGATGRLIGTVFGAGAKEGDNMVVSLTGVINKLNAYLQTAEGQKRMAQFFAESANTVKQLVTAIAPIVQILFNITSATRPLTNALLEVTGTIAKWSDAITKIQAVRTAMLVFASFVVGWVAVSKTWGLVQAFIDFRKQAIVQLSLLRARAATFFLWMKGAAATMAASFRGAITIMISAMARLRAAFAALTAAMAANPVGAVVAALAILTIAFITAYKKSETFRNIVNAALRAVRDAAVAVVDKILGAFSSFLTGISKVAKALGQDGLGNAAKKGADAIDGLREAIRKVPDHKTVDVKVNVKLKDLVDNAFDPTSPTQLHKSPQGGPVNQVIDSDVGRLVQKKAATNKHFAESLLQSMGSGTLGSGKPAGAGLNTFNAVGRRFGLTVGSGLRPGDPGWHGKGRARDFPGSPGAMMAFARYMASHFGRSLKELIYTPLGFGIKNGQKVPLSFWGRATNADHYDHVHVAAAQGARMPQRVTKPTTVLYGEEPGHPEYFISTNPRYRKRSAALLASAAAEILPMASGGSIGSSGRAAQIMRFFMGQGFTKGQAAAWVGVLGQESGLSTTVVNNTSGATGLAQWLGPRLSRLKSKKNWSSLGTQLAYIMEELRGPERSAFNRIKKAKGLTEAVNAITWGFERPGKAEANITNRLAIGRSAYSSNKGGGSGSGGTISDSAVERERKKLEAKIERNKKLIDQLHKEARHLPSKGSKGRRADIGDKVAELHAQNRQIYKEIRDLPKSGEVPRRGETQTFGGLVQNQRDKLTFAGTTQRVFDDLTQTGRLENLLGFQQAKDRTRLKKIEKDLAGKLTKATRERLLSEQDEIHQRVWATAAERTTLRTRKAELGVEAFFAGGRGRQGLELQGLQAQATPGLEDDVENMKQNVALWQRLLFIRTARGDLPGQIEAQGQLNSYSQNLHDTLIQINDARIANMTNMIQANIANFEAAVDNAQYTVDLWDDVATTNDLINQIPTMAFVAAQGGNQAYANELMARIPGLQKQAQDLAKRANDAPYEASLALAQLTENTSDDLLALQGLLQIHQERLAAAKNANDYLGIIDEAGAVKQLQDQIEGIKGSSQNIEAQSRNLSQARLDLYRNFGSNARISWASESGMTSAGPSVNVYNTFTEAPTDPHLLARGMAWEVQTAF